MKHHTVKKGSVLYTGSQRIFAIQCYIEQHRWVWERYLELTKRSRDTSGIDAPTWDQIEQVVLQINKQMASLGEDNMQAWSPHVVFVAVLEQLAYRFIYNVSVAAVIRELYRRKGMPLGGREFLQFAEAVETGLESLDVEFYSVMRQPIQFFGNRATASVYSDYIYKYVLEDSVRLVDISNKESSQELLTTVFQSWEPYSDDDLAYYTRGEPKPELRYDSLAFAKERWPRTLEDFLFRLIKYFGFKSFPPTNITMLSEKWLEYFGHELISPRGLWIISQLQFLEGMPTERRNDHYSSDALIIKTFTTGTGLDGWYCSNPQEWMIYHPERYGFLKPDQKYEFKGEACDFVLPSPPIPQAPDQPENLDLELPLSLSEDEDYSTDEEVEPARMREV